MASMRAKFGVKAFHELAMPTAGEVARSASESPRAVFLPNASEGPTCCGRGRPHAGHQRIMVAMRARMSWRLFLNWIEP